MFHLLGALKLFNAYYGQFSHRQAHTMKNDRSAWVNWCQDHGLLLTSATHWVHHTTYKDNFSINNGLCEPILATLYKHIPNRWFWIGLFATMTVGDGYFLRHCV